MGYLPDTPEQSAADLVAELANMRPDVKVRCIDGVWTRLYVFNGVWCDRGPAGHCHTLYTHSYQRGEKHIWARDLYDAGAKMVALDFHFKPREPLTIAAPSGEVWTMKPGDGKGFVDQRGNEWK